MPSALKTRQMIPRTPEGHNPHDDDPSWKRNFKLEDPFDLAAYLDQDKTVVSARSDMRETLAGDR